MIAGRINQKLFIAGLCIILFSQWSSILYLAHSDIKILEVKVGKKEKIEESYSPEIKMYFNNGIFSWKLSKIIKSKTVQNIKRKFGYSSFVSNCDSNGYFYTTRDTSSSKDSPFAEKDIRETCGDQPNCVLLMNGKNYRLRKEKAETIKCEKIKPTAEERDEVEEKILSETEKSILDKNPIQITLCDHPEKNNKNPKNILPFDLNQEKILNALLLNFGNSLTICAFYKGDEITRMDSRVIDFYQENKSFRDFINGKKYMFKNMLKTFVNKNQIGNLENFYSYDLTFPKWEEVREKIYNYLESDRVKNSSDEEYMGVAKQQVIQVMFKLSKEELLKSINEL